MCFLKELGKLDCAFQAILNRNLMKHVKIYKSASVKSFRLNQKFFSVPNGYLEGIWLIWPTGVSVLHVSLFGSPRLKKYMRQFNLKIFITQALWPQNWILYGKNPERSKSMAVGSHSKTPFKSTLNPGHSKPSQPNPPTRLILWFLLAVTIDVSFFFPQQWEGFRCWGSHMKKAWNPAGGNSVTWRHLKGIIEKALPGVFGVESKSPMSQILSTLNRRKLFLHRKKKCRYFVSRRLVRCHSPNKRISYQNAKKNAKNGSLRWLPLLVPQSRCDSSSFSPRRSVSQIGREMFIFVGKKNQYPFSINPFSMGG